MRPASSGIRVRAWYEIRPADLVIALIGGGVTLGAAADWLAQRGKNISVERVGWVSVLIFLLWVVIVTCGRMLVERFCGVFGERGPEAADLYMRLVAACLVVVYVLRLATREASGPVHSVFWVSFTAWLILVAIAAAFALPILLRFSKRGG
jgi:hypothetical protein